MSAATEWTTVQRKKVWASPMPSLRREDTPRPPQKKGSEFPSLPGIQRPTVAGTGLNFRDVAKESAARFERDEATRLAEQARMARAVSYEEIASRRTLSCIPTRCYDDGPSDYDPPEEDEYDESSYEESNYQENGYDGGYEETPVATDETVEESATSYSYYAANGMRRGRNEFW